MMCCEIIYLKIFGDIHQIVYMFFFLKKQISLEKNNKKICLFSIY